MACRSVHSPGMGQPFFRTAVRFVLFLLVIGLAFSARVQASPTRQVVITYDISKSVGEPFVKKPAQARLRQYLQSIIHQGWSAVTVDPADKVTVGPLNELSQGPLWTPGSPWAVLKFGDTVQMVQDALAATPAPAPLPNDLLFPAAFPDNNTDIKAAVSKICEFATHANRSQMDLYWVYVSDDLMDVDAPGWGQKNDWYTLLSSRYSLQTLLAVKVAGGGTYQGSPAAVYIQIRKTSDLFASRVQEMLAALEQIKAPSPFPLPAAGQAGVASMQALDLALGKLNQDVANTENSNTKIKTLESNVAAMENGMKELVVSYFTNQLTGLSRDLDEKEKTLSPESKPQAADLRKQIGELTLLLPKLSNNKDEIRKFQERVFQILEGVARLGSPAGMSSPASVSAPVGATSSDGTAGKGLIVLIVVVLGLVVASRVLGGGKTLVLEMATVTSDGDIEQRNLKLAMKGVILLKADEKNQEGTYSADSTASLSREEKGIFLILSDGTRKAVAFDEPFEVPSEAGAVRLRIRKIGSC